MKKRIIIIAVIVIALAALSPLLINAYRFTFISVEYEDKYKHQWESDDKALSVEVNCSHDLLAASIFENGIYKCNGKEIKVALCVGYGLFHVTTTPNSSDGIIFTGTYDYNWYLNKYYYTVDSIRKPELCGYSVGDTFEMKKID